MNMLPYSGIPALPKNIEDMHAQLVALGLNDVEALTARIKKCEDWVDNVEETELTDNPVVFQNALAVPAASLEATIEPIQDLHGYDHPWAGGADLQQLPPEIGIVAGDESITITENSDGSYTITASETVESTIVNDATISLPAGDYAINAFNTAKEAQIHIMDSASAVVGNISLDTANVSGIFTSANAITKFRLRLLSGFSGSLTIKPMIVTGSTAPTSYCPYSNICPISGRTETSVLDHGKNLFDKTNADLYVGYIDGNSKLVSSSHSRIIILPCKPNTNYTVSKIVSARFTIGYTVKYPQTGTSVYNKTSDDTSTSLSILTGADAKYLVAWVFNDSYDTVALETILDSVQIEEGSAATAYEPYKSSSATISFGQTVYGGQVDFKTGIVAVEWGYIASYNGETIPGEWISDRDAYASGTTPTTGAEVAYKLATPTELTLSPAQLEMLKGYNSVSSDDASSLTVTAYTGGPWEPITRAIKKVTNKTKTTKKRRK